MNRRRTLTGLLLATGLVVAVNRLLTERARTLGRRLPGRTHRYPWRGFDVVYDEAGDPDDPDLVLLHGIHAVASADEFSRLAECLESDFHVIAPDLPGFGRSDRPAVSYSSDLYESFLREFLEDVAENPIVVASSLTGAYALEASEDASVDQLVLICPTDETAPERPWLRTLLETPVVGTALFNLLVSRRSIASFLRREGYYDPESIPPGSLEYAWHSAHQPGARLAPASFVAGTLDPDGDLETAIDACEVPVTLVWGRDATVVPLRRGRALARAADLDLVIVDYAKVLPHDEHPERFREYLLAEIATSDR